MATKWILVLHVVGLCSLLHGKDRLNSDSQRSATAILVNQFETVAYANTVVLSSFEKRSSPQKNSKTIPNLPKSLKLPFVQLIGGLRALGPNIAELVEVSYSGGFVMGAKDFQAPQGLGMVSSRDCYIGLLQNGIQPAIDAYFNSAGLEIVDKRRVWTWSVPPYEGHPTETTFYAAQIANSFFLMTNNRQDFREIAGHLSSAIASDIKQASPVVEWNTIENQKYWAFRVIRHKSRADPSVTGVTSTIVALVFTVDFDRMISDMEVYGSDKAASALPKGVFAPELFNVRPASPGRWRATSSISPGEGVDRVLFGVFYLLGFGVVL